MTNALFWYLFGLVTHGICVDYADGYKQQGLTFTDAATYLEKARSKK